MISEKQLARYFHSFWQHHFPLLNPGFVRRFNLENKERLLARDGSAVPPISMGRDLERFDLVAELAFEFARENCGKVIASYPNSSKAVKKAVSHIAKLRGELSIASPSAAERAEAVALANVHKILLDSTISQEAISFKPRIRGAGILDEMEADFCTKSTLFEVKTVNRNVESGDLRQLVCYLIAGLGSGEYAWTDYCIFNPRLAVVYYGRVDEFLAYISGRTPHECIADVLDALMEREQPLEAEF